MPDRSPTHRCPQNEWPADSPLQDDRETLADADADRGDRDAAAAAGEFVRGVADDAAARCAERVADRDRAAVDVDPLGVEVRPQLQAREGLRREGLVELDEVDVRPGLARRARARGSRPRPARRRTRPGRCRRRPRPVMRARGSASSAPSPPSSSAEAPSLIGDELPAVTVPSAANSALQPAELLERRVVADALVPRELVTVDLHDLVVVDARSPGPRPRAGGCAARTRPARRARCRRSRRASRPTRRSRSSSPCAAPGWSCATRSRCSTWSGCRRRGTASADFSTTYGARLIDSTPPARMMSASPASIARDALDHGLDRRPAQAVDGHPGHARREARPAARRSARRCGCPPRPGSRRRR